MSPDQLRVIMNGSEKKILVPAPEEPKVMAVGFMTAYTLGLHIFE